MPFIDLVSSEDQAFLKAAYTTVVEHSRFGPIDISLRGAGEKPQQVTLFASHLPDRANRLFITLSARRISPQTSAPENIERDAETALLDKDSFAEVAMDVLKGSAGQDKNYSMTLLNMEGLQNLEKRLDKNAVEELMTEVSAYLQVNSVNGESASRIDENQFGIVHYASVDVTTLEQTISERVLEADPDGKGLTVNSSTIELEADDQISEEDAARALVYSINKFSEQPGDFTVSAINDGYKQMLDETVEKIAEFKAMIQAGRFDVVFQPIVDLKARKIHHSEALVRFHDSEPGVSPFALITFAEEVGVIGEFDLAMCERVIKKITQANDHGHQLHIAVNISGRSLEDKVFLKAFGILLSKHEKIRTQLMFEVTESAEIMDLDATNNFITGLREKGHHVCLDEFGAGAAAFQYLRALDIDFVKSTACMYARRLSKRAGNRSCVRWPICVATLGSIQSRKWWKMRRSRVF
jgi:EAL domain-containing protein (putative c-di-GMP-specific phosphodiesterase class I)